MKLRFDLENVEKSNEKKNNQTKDNEKKFVNIKKKKIRLNMSLNLNDNYDLVEGIEENDDQSLNKTIYGEGSPSFDVPKEKLGSKLNNFRVHKICESKMDVKIMRCLVWKCKIKLM